ncbi:hypothetical protein GW7_18898 [Heterocephalus glaber]|uniref:Tubulin epsilon and delta complex protein 1 domain-containing protein n=1 Tax=Heterocephalus glaber TaxID=10181 RepID=G5AWK3_HETGA|nr:hypothetical protein GW7_18898 [Heterocephalus glaber]
MDGGAAAWTGAGPRTLPEAIATLSRSLPAGPSPEIFRRAKFDHPEAAPVLWRLLFRVLAPLRANCAAASLGRGAQARWVKVVLHYCGYPRPALAQLPEDGSQGSRELLLAFSWLLARVPLLEWLLSQTCVQLGDQVPTFECEALASPGLAAPQVDARRSVDLRRLQWLMGKLRFRWRSLICSQQEQCALLSKIHTYTHGCHSDQNLGHLSVTETEMLRDPEDSQQASSYVCTPQSGYMAELSGGEAPGSALSLGPAMGWVWGPQLLRVLERENARLEAALEWRQCELIFWQWMDTVLGACPPEGPAVPTFLPRIPEHGCQELELVARELQALQEKLREQVLSRRQAWETQVGGLGHGPEWSAARQALQQTVEQELLALQRSWEQERGPSLTQGPHRLVKIKAGTAGAQGLPVAEVIRALRSQEASLEAMLCWLQGQCRQELARLAGAVPGLLWILPPGC